MRSLALDKELYDAVTAQGMSDSMAQRLQREGEEFRHHAAWHSYRWDATGRYVGRWDQYGDFNEATSKEAKELSFDARKV